MKKADQKPVSVWVLLCLVNAIVIYFASIFFPSNIVLGNAMLYGWAAVVIISLLLALLLSLVVPTLRASKLVTTKGASSEIIYYGVVNILGLWLLARAAVYTGFGISSLFVAVILGLVLTFFQYAMRKAFADEKNKR